MAAETRPPEQIIRDWLVDNGPIEVGVGALEQTWKRRPLDDEDRREIAAALAGAGVACEPPVTELAEGGQMRLSVAEAEPEVEPEPEPEVEPEPEPEAEVAPADRVRDWLAANGPTTVSLEALARTWDIEAPKARDRRRMASDLSDAGVYTDPPLRGLRSGEAIGLSLDPPAPEPPPPAPPPPAPEPAREPEPEPAAPVAREPDPEPAPATDSAADDGEPVPTRLLAWLGGAFALMVIGAVTPWSRNVFVVDYGLDREGLIVIVAAVVAAAVVGAYLYANTPGWFPMVSAAIGAFATAVVAGDYRDLVDDSFVGPAWGIYVAFVGSAAVVVLSMFLLVRSDDEPG